jgi:hypothetical protein
MKPEVLAKRRERVLAQVRAIQYEGKTEVERRDAIRRRKERLARWQREESQ